MTAKKLPQTKRIVNRRARFDYELGDSLVVGLQLTGAETKALRQNSKAARLSPLNY
jgi:tmRNA-binding protein